MYDHVLHGSHSDLEQVGVGRVCVVNVDLLFRLPHKITELVCKKVHTGLNVSGLACVVWEDFADWAHAASYLFAEEIDLVEEENESGLLEVFGVGDGFEEHQGLMHLVLQQISKAYLKLHRLEA